MAYTYPDLHARVCKLNSAERDPLVKTVSQAVFHLQGSAATHEVRLYLQPFSLTYSVGMHESIHHTSFHEVTLGRKRV